MSSIRLAKIVTLFYVYREHVTNKEMQNITTKKIRLFNDRMIKNISFFQKMH